MTPRSSLPLALLIIGLGAFPFSTVPAFGDDTSNQLTQALFDKLKARFPAQDVSLDLSIPSAPAFAVLGVSPDTVLQPGEPRQLATALVNSLDERGNLQQGVAIDSAPFLQRVNLDEYRRNSSVRMLALTRLSIATTKGRDDDDKATRAAIGLNIPLLYKGDPRLNDNLLNVLRQVIATAIENKGVFPPQPEATPEEKAARAKEIEKAVNSEIVDLKDTPTTPPAGETDTERKAREKKLVRLDSYARAFLTAISNPSAETIAAFRKEAEKEPAWTLAVAPAFFSPDGKNNSLRGDGVGVWTSYGIGIGGSGDRQIILHARYRNKEQVPDSNNAGQYLEQKSTLVGLRYRVGGNKLKYSLEGAYINVRQNGQGKDNGFTYGLILEPKLSKDLWLNLSIKSDSGLRDGSKIGFRSAVSYGFK